ncbi:MAG TPA: ATP synthase F1 subunit gamma [Myxococcales bacterium]|nr:ATP synthase F1 subunit gamma [Myxococcales bacterium]
MASLRDIRKRIRSVRNTRQITKAMKMVAAAKLRRAQDAIIAARPYSNMLDELIRELAARSEGLAHPLLQPREPKKVELVVLTSDRGLAGGFNSNVIRRANRFLFENASRYPEIQLSTIGRKAHDFFKKQPRVNLRRDYAGMYARVSYRAAADLAQELSQRCLRGDVDAVFLVYNEFISAISQRVTLTQMLPLQSLAAPEPEKDQKAAAAAASLVDFKYEPGRQEVLDRLVPQALAIKLYRALLESVAAEHGARMSAMENATNNASDMIGKLTLLYNRTRQAVITKELMEIVSGAEAQKG